MAIEQAVSQAEHTINMKSHNNNIIIHVLAQIPVYYYDIVHVGQCPLLQYLFISRSVYIMLG